MGIFWLGLSSLSVWNYKIWNCCYYAGLEEIMGFLEQSFPDVEVAIAHGKVFYLSFFPLLYASQNPLVLYFNLTEGMEASFRWEKIFVIEKKEKTRRQRTGSPSYSQVLKKFICGFKSLFTFEGDNLVKTYKHESRKKLEILLSSTKVQLRLEL